MEEFSNWLEIMMERTIVNQQLAIRPYSDLPDVFKMTLEELYNDFCDKENKPMYSKVHNYYKQEDTNKMNNIDYKTIDEIEVDLDYKNLNKVNGKFEVIIDNEKKYLEEACPFRMKLVNNSLSQTLKRLGDETIDKIIIIKNYGIANN